MAIVITVCIEKGGVGKTATAVNLAAAAALDGKRVLVVDVDAQANSTYFLTGHLLRDDAFLEHSLYDLFRTYNTHPTSEFITKTQIAGLDLIPSDTLTPEIMFGSLRRRFSLKDDFHFLLNRIAEVADDYDVVIIDTPPARDSKLVQNAMVASDYLIMPLKLDQQCMESLQNTKKEMEILAEDAGEQIRILGIVPTMVEKTALTGYYMEILSRSEEFKDLLFKTSIRKGNSVNESSVFGKPVVCTAKSSNPAKDYFNLWKEVKRRIRAYGEVI